MVPLVPKKKKKNFNILSNPMADAGFSFKEDKRQTSMTIEKKNLTIGSIILK